jgi:cytidylate kinase
MLIILEGTDANFKSTIANKLHKLLGFNIVKGSSFEMAKESNEKLFQRFVEIAEMNNAIVDRYIYSNLTYAPLYKDFSVITTEQQYSIEDYLLHKNTLLVYLFADSKVIQKRLKERGDDYVKTEEIKAINDKYEEVLKTVRLPVLRMNTEFLNSDVIANTIVNSVYRRLTDSVNMESTFKKNKL